MTRDHGQARSCPRSAKPVTLHTADGLNLVGELALPDGRAPVATLICLHPLPTRGRDDGQPRAAQGLLPAARAGRPRGAAVQHPRHLVRARAPARARSATARPSGYDVAAAIGYAVAARLPRLWLLGWSFGTELALRWGNDPAVEGAILLSPLAVAGRPTRTWTAGRRPAARWSRWCRSSTTTCGPTRPGPGSPGCRRPRSSGVDKAKHLWVGEPYVRIVLNEIVRRVNPAAWPLPTEWKD